MSTIIPKGGSHELCDGGDVQMVTIKKASDCACFPFFLLTVGAVWLAFV